MYGINTNCLNLTFTALLRHLLLHSIYHPASFAMADLFEVSHLATSCTCLAICQALSWLVCSSTVSAWLSLCGPAYWSSSNVTFWFLDILTLSNCLGSVKVFSNCCLGPLCFYPLAPHQHASTHYVIIIFGNC